MRPEDFNELIKYLAKRGLEVFSVEDINEFQPKIDYLAIFARDEEEYLALENVAETLGPEVDKETAKTGRTFKLTEAVNTIAGELFLLKIRRPDATRPQRGAPDFKIQKYREFKDKYITTSGNFTLMLKPTYEMIEIKGVDVLVYVPSDTLTERMAVK